MIPFSKSIPHVVVRPAVQVGRQQAFTRGHSSVVERPSYKGNAGGSSPSARTSTMNTKTANVHQIRDQLLLPLTCAGTAVCVLA